MRIRYAYELTNEDGSTKFVVINHIKSEEEVKDMFADKGCVSAKFHERVRTGFRLDAEGNLVETGLTKSEAQPAPAEPEAPKGKKVKKAKKAA